MKKSWIVISIILLVGVFSAAWALNSGLIGKKAVNSYQVRQSKSKEMPKPNNKLSANEQEKLNTALIEASTNNQINAVKRLVTAGADPSAQDDEGGTPLICAARNGNAAMVKFLLDSKADPFATDCGEYDFMTYASGSGNVETMQLILDYGYSPDGEGIDGLPLWNAVMHENWDVVKLLLKAGANPDALDAAFYRRSHSMSEDLEMAKLLIAAGADPDKDWGGEREKPIMEAIKWSSPQAAKILLALGASSNRGSQDELYNPSPLGFALEQKSFDNAKLLIASGADLNSSTGNEISVAQYKEQLGLDDKLQSRLIPGGKFKVWAKPVGGKQGEELLKAAWQNNTAKVKQLLAAGANPNSCSKYGTTPLMVASAMGNAEMVQELVKAGAEINKRDVAGDTSLIYAILLVTDPQQQENTVTALVKAGADPDVTGYWGDSASVWGKKTAGSKTQKLLLEGGH
ncbi:MAG: ankyrin repeat domain-containing protein [Candidatus Saccharibacteria bacterium]